MTTSNELLQVTGADTINTLGGKLHSLHFPVSPDPKVWRQVGGGWMPRRNTRAGREIADMLNAFTKDSA